LRNSLKITCCLEVSDEGVLVEVGHILDVSEGATEEAIDED